MPNVSDGLVEITMKGSYVGKPWANVYHYWRGENVAVEQMAQLGNLFRDNIQEQISVLVSENVLFTEILVRDVFGVNNDVFIAISEQTGQKVGESVASFDAVAFSMGVQSKETKKGAKRYVGIPESDQAQGFLTASAFSAWQGIQSNHTIPLNASNIVYRPVVYGKPIPTNLTRNVVNNITSASVSQELTSQISRK